MTVPVLVAPATVLMVKPASRALCCSGVRLKLVLPSTRNAVIAWVALLADGRLLLSISLNVMLPLSLSVLASVREPVVTTPVI